MTPEEQAAADARAKTEADAKTTASEAAALLARKKAEAEAEAKKVVTMDTIDAVERARREAEAKHGARLAELEKRLGAPAPKKGGALAIVGVVLLVVVLAGIGAVEFLRRRGGK